VNQRELRCFVEVAATKNFSRAAANLFVTQPTISNHIKHLETELGVKLFNRAYHDITLTTYGRLLVPAAKQILGIHADLLKRINILQKMHSASEKPQTLRVGIYVTEDQNKVLKTIELFKADFPSVAIVIDNALGDSMVEQLKTGRLDLAAGMIVPDKAVEWHFLYNDKYVVYVAEKFLRPKQRTISLADLAGMTLLVPSYKGLSNYKRKQGQLLQWKDSVEVGSVEVGLLNLKLSNSFMFLPESGIQLKDPQIKKVALADSDQRANLFPVGIARLRGNDNPAIDQFIRFQELLNRH
jgi:DNA-binding transcriptional LysR family regulator